MISTSLTATGTEKEIGSTREATALKLVYQKW